MADRKVEGRYSYKYMGLDSASCDCTCIGFSSVGRSALVSVSGRVRLTSMAASGAGIAHAAKFSSNVAIRWVGCGVPPKIWWC